MTNRSNRYWLDILSVFLLPILFRLTANIPTLPFSNNGMLVLYTIAELLQVFLFPQKSRESFQPIRFKMFKVSDIFHGLVLGLLISVLQLLPLLALMGMDLSAFKGIPLDWNTILHRFLFCLVTVGLVEEVFFRGFIFNESNRVLKNKVVVVALNCLLFYMLHLPNIAGFDPIRLYSTTVTAALCCGYLYLFPKRSLLAPIVAHAFYDTLVVGGTVFILLAKLF